MEMDQISAIGRPVDPNYPTNRAIMLVTLVVVAGGAISRWLMGAGLLPGGLWGVNAGLAVFLAWALCREMDPDHAWSAFVAAGLAILGLLWGQPDLLVLFWVLMVVRVVNRTVGLPATVLDLLLVVGLSGWLVWQQGNWIYGLMAGVAFLLDSQLAKANEEQRASTPTHDAPSERRCPLCPVVFAVVTIVATGVWTVLQGNWWAGDGGAALSFVQGGAGTAFALATLAMAALFVPVIVGASQLNAVCDRTDDPLQPTRVQAAQGIAILTGIQLGFWAGKAGVVSVMPLWAAVVGAALYRLAVGPLLTRFLKRGRPGDA